MWWSKPASTPVQPVQSKPWPFMQYRWAGFIATAAVLIVTTASILLQGLNLGLDFTGGVMISAERAAPFDSGEVRRELSQAGLSSDASITLADDGRTLFVRLPSASWGADADAMANRLTAALGEGVSVRSIDTVGPKVSGQLMAQSVFALLLAVLGIAAYVWFRFEIKFGWAALITTFHDVYAIIGLFSITHMTFDLTAVAGVLTIAGYSVNDKVVIFDRIREMLRKHKKLLLPDLIDVAITATLSRTLITAICVLLPGFALLFLGGPVLFGLSAAICFGVIIGTFSSIFVAAPLLIHLPGPLRRVARET